MLRKRTRFIVANTKLRNFAPIQCTVELGLRFAYSRMQVPSLSRGCEIAQFFVRPTAGKKRSSADATETKIWEGVTKDDIRVVLEVVCRWYGHSIVIRKSTFHLRFIVPKSSFGRPNNCAIVATRRLGSIHLLQKIMASNGTLRPPGLKWDTHCMLVMFSFHPVVQCSYLRIRHGRRIHIELSDILVTITVIVPTYDNLIIWYSGT